jgi:hypothetical protein
VRRRVGLTVLALTAGCTSVQVTPVDRPLERVCIERNPKVIVEDFVPVVQTAFLSHGVTTVVYDAPVPADCRVVMTYTARRGWDMAPYLKYAELRLTDGCASIGEATYRHGGWFGLNKWAGTASKMNPVVNRLLANARPPS